jgi:NAD-dependent deacetylase
LVLTGAGISAESGIPTFRGAEGYWVVGSRNYQPEQLATRSAFARDPALVWGWYLHRRGVCRRAAPNAAHRALVELERARGDRFLLLTQNVDGLHLLAGHHSAARCLQIHGNLHWMRCTRERCGVLTPVPESLPLDWPRGRSPMPQELALLRCAACGETARPHVLWFDECYDEEHFHYDTALAAAESCALLLVIGTSGATSLPAQVVERAARAGAALVIVNAEPSPFSRLAEAAGGMFLQGTAVTLVPQLVARIMG